MRFQVRGEYITLGQLLKVVGHIGTGGEVKSFLAEAAILVNNEAENRRGRKLRPGDVVVLEGVETITLYGEDEPEDEELPVGAGGGAEAGPAVSDLAKKVAPNQATVEPRTHIKKSTSKRRVKPRRS